MATAEFAISLLGLSIVAQALLAGVSIFAAQLQASDAAGIAARLAARGENSATVQRALHQVAPNAVVALSKDNGVVVARVSVRPGLAFARHLVGQVSATGRSVDEVESTSATGER